MLINQQTNSYLNRKFVIITIFVVIGLVFIVRLFSLQVLDTSYKLSASRNILRHITDYPARGLIYDRNGELLVHNEPFYDLMVIPGQVGEIDTVSFCNLTGITIESFERRMQNAKQFSYHRGSIFIGQIEKDSYAYIQEHLHKFPGFYVQSRTLRNYVYPVAAHIFGYVGEASQRIIDNNPYYQPGDYVGISGIEKYYEEFLRGEKGVKIKVVDALGREIGPYQDERYDTIAIAGEDLYTTLDIDLQIYGEKLMQNKIGSIVAIEPSSGEILSMVSTPNYDPNLLVGRVRTQNFLSLYSDTLKPIFNRALMAEYPPGSVFKVISTLIGLQEGVVQPNTRLYCPGYYQSRGITVRCREHKNPVDLTGSIKYSCNTYAANLFRNVIDQDKYKNIQESFTTWRDHVTSFGLGNVFNNDLPYELSGIVANSDYYDNIYGSNGWSSLTILSLGIGQGELGTTPMQLANVAATIGNRGFYKTPHIVRAIDDPENKNSKFNNKKYSTIDEEHFDFIAESMFQVVDEGTGRFSRIEDIEMAGKTGTVQNPHGENHSVFIAFAPKDDPEIAISVVIENSGYGATWAAPVASLMIEKYLTRQVERKWFEQRILDANFINPEKHPDKQ